MLGPLIAIALKISNIHERTGRRGPNVITWDQSCTVHQGPRREPCDILLLRFNLHTFLIWSVLPCAFAVTSTPQGMCLLFVLLFHYVSPFLFCLYKSPCKVFTSFAHIYAHVNHYKNPKGSKSVFFMLMQKVLYCVQYDSGVRNTTLCRSRNA